MKGAYYTKQYRNVFAECGHSQEEIDKKLKDAFHTVFYGPAGEKFYFEAGDDMGYFEDTGNFNARTEGMSYAMMMCMEDGYNKGYFAWSCKTTGEKNDYGPAPDGEEFFAMSLFFASHRWGDGEGIFNYSQEAKNILSACIHNGEKEPGDPIMEPENYLIRFIPSRKFSDPSYHCAHFYELFSMWANEEDRPFWKKATSSAMRFACARLWVTITMVKRSFRFLSSSSILAEAFTSRAEQGSSKSSTFGSTVSALAMHRHCF